ncbi:unnamed protein product [Bursaphelenchus xylophilus]|uniref:(pine wood nematode) hypothetical protein n=1 Tax=Bursaphelenchus xylophilus TaxID=6326 RepID=A0A1I7STB2_BURXY|nr:unnamed protein product [Bursaphelenchus xylophilus]CAG9108597.1 unnamed protein product [Bursaphelenchus xylophilus]
MVVVRSHSVVVLPTSSSTLCRCTSVPTLSTLRSTSSSYYYPYRHLSAIYDNYWTWRNRYYSPYYSLPYYSYRPYYYSDYVSPYRSYWSDYYPYRYYRSSYYPYYSYNYFPYSTYLNDLAYRYYY